jgi:hypothetical protein
MAGARDQGTGVASTVFGSAFDSGVFDDVLCEGSAANVFFIVSA